MRLALTVTLAAALAVADSLDSYQTSQNQIALATFNVHSVYAAAKTLNVDLQAQAVPVAQGPRRQQDGYCASCDRQAGCGLISTIPVPLVSGAAVLSPLWEITSSKTCVTQQLDGACNTFLTILPNLMMLFRVLTSVNGSIEIQVFLEGDSKDGLGHFRLHGVSLNEGRPHNKVISERLINLPLECLASGTACLVLQRCSYYGNCCDIDSKENELFGVCSTPYVNSTACKQAMKSTGLGGPEFVDLPQKLKTKCVCSLGNRKVLNRERIDDANCIYLPKDYDANAFD